MPLLPAAAGVGRAHAPRRRGPVAAARDDRPDSDARRPAARARHGRCPGSKARIRSESESGAQRIRFRQRSSTQSHWLHRMYGALQSLLPCRRHPFGCGGKCQVGLSIRGISLKAPALEGHDRSAPVQDLVHPIVFLNRLDGEPSTELARSLPFFVLRLSAPQHAARSDPLRQASTFGSAPALNGCFC